MMMKKNNYWIDRANKTTDKSIAATNKQLAKYYKTCQKNVIDSFEKLYDELLAQEEPTPANLYKLDRYYQMQAQLQQELNKLGDKSTKLLSKRFTEQYKDVYMNIALPSEQSFATIDNAEARQMANQIWCADNKSWSQRVWNNTARLQNTLNESLIDCAVTGKKTSDLKRKLREDFSVSYNSANTLVKTEMSHLQNAAAAQRYKDYGIKEYEILADDSCDECKQYDGKRFPLDGAQLVPFHPNCRCCIIPVIDDNN